MIFPDHGGHGDHDLGEATHSMMLMSYRTEPMGWRSLAYVTPRPKWTGERVELWRRDGSREHELVLLVQDRARDHGFLVHGHTWPMEEHPPMP